MDKLYSLADLKRDLAKRGQRVTRDSEQVVTSRKSTLESDSATGSVEYLDGGYISKGVNEVSLISTIDDPTKNRQGSQTHTIYGIDSGNRIDADGIQREKVMVMYREDEDTRGHDGGCVDIFLQNPDTDDDANMIRRFTLTPNHLTLTVPIRGADVPSPSPDPSPTRVSEMWSGNGRYVTRQQDDGNFVTYDTSMSPWKAVWSAWHGTIG